jgi:NAD(P)-dependent dehydrogenase (short-subunit alcohol dehydrogenase family)
MSVPPEHHRGIAGKTFIVTGAGSGIGEAVCLLLSDRGASVAAVDLDAETAKRTTAKLPGPAVAIAADVTTPEGTAAYIAASAEALGDIDGVHLNAGVLGTPMPLADTEPTDYDWEMGVNAKGVYLGLRGAIRRMRTQGRRGSIVVTASTAGLGGSQSLGIYSASKHAAVGLVRAAALDHAADGIRVNAICPGEVDTPMLQRAIDTFSPTPGEREATRDAIAMRIPAGRVADPGELALAAVWLLSEDSTYVTGTTLVVDGGLTAGRFTAGT